MNGNKLYFELSRIYSCKYPDNKEEMNDAIYALERELNAKRVTPELLIEKIQELKEATGDFTSKLSAHIIGQYWLKNYRRSIPYRPFIND